MGFIDFVDYVQALTPINVFPYAIPDDAAEDAIVLNLEPRYTTNKGGLYESVLKVHTRSNHPEKAEQYAIDLINHFTDRTSFNIGSYRVVLSSMNNKFPLYVNKDSLERHTYTFDVYLKMQK